MKAFVIKNKEGKYWQWLFNHEPDWEDKLYNGFMCYFKEDAKKSIIQWQLKDCEVVEVTISEGNLEQQLAEKDQRIAELKEQLANSIRPKFKVEQTVYRIYQDKIENGMISEIRVDEIGITYHITMYKSKYCETYCYVNENDLFSTKEEALAKLKEIKGENK